MKKIIVFTLLLTISITSFSQTSTNPAPTVKTDYLKKSKKQNRVANFMLGGGATFVLATFVIPRGERVTTNTGGTLFGVPVQSAYYKNDGIKGAFFLIGTISMLSSIPIYLASHRNKKKGKSLSLKNETILEAQKYNFVYKPIPSLALRISL